MGAWRSLTAAGGRIAGGGSDLSRLAACGFPYTLAPPPKPLPPGASPSPPGLSLPGRGEGSPSSHCRLCPLRQPQENHLMERSELFDLMGELQLYGMKAAFDEIMATAVKRQHEPQRIVGDLLKAEISEKQARSIKYQLPIAKLPLAKDLHDFQFGGTPINETLVNELA